MPIPPALLLRRCRHRRRCRTPPPGIGAGSTPPPSPGDKKPWALQPFRRGRLRRPVAVGSITDVQAVYTPLVYHFCLLWTQICKICLILMKSSKFNENFANIKFQIKFEADVLGRRSGSLPQNFRRAGPMMSTCSTNFVVSTSGEFTEPPRSRARATSSAASTPSVGWLTHASESRHGAAAQGVAASAGGRGAATFSVTPFEHHIPPAPSCGLSASRLDCPIGI
jgi:hypothetical protein